MSTPKQPSNETDALTGKQSELAAWEGFARDAIKGLLSSGQFHSDRDGLCEEARMIANLMTYHWREFRGWLRERKSED